MFQSGLTTQSFVKSS